MPRAILGFLLVATHARVSLMALVLIPLAGVAIGADDAVGDGSAEAPVKRIVLFTSGVGYFEHRGKVAGNATIELKFDVDDVNDLLKSMVLEDLDGGKISTVTYGSRDPLAKTLKTFAIDVTQTPSLAHLLTQIRGQRIAIDAPIKAAGAIVSIERQRQASKELGVVETELLTLLTDEGLRRIPLDSIGQIKLADEALDAEFRKALEVLAMGRASDKKAVKLEFLGEGERDVRVGYIQTAPVWKTSYRLVLDEQEKPLLQGWAIVENTTDADWQDVRLSLVSGRPISFVMDLYSPLYADRPLVTPELFSSLRPQVYDQDLQRERKMVRQEQINDAYSRAVPAAASPADAPAEDQAAAGQHWSALQAGRGQAGGMGGGMGGFGLAGVESAEAGDALAELGKSVSPAAQGAEVGELFKYEIDNPVTLARQTSAMLPIINDAIEGEKLSIYNAAVHAKHPLDGVRLKNSSELHLMQGPVTVFDGGVYAGDARLPDLSPGGERLLSYALDLDIEVAVADDSQPQSIVSAKLEKGVMAVSYKQRRSQTFTLKSAGETTKTVLIERPIEQGWDLVAPQEPTEKTRDVYRFAVEVGPDASTELKVEEQQLVSQTFTVSDQEAGQLQLYVNSDGVSEKVKEGLREVIRRRTALAELTSAKERLAQRIAAIAEEQSRLRENMQAIDRNTDLYTRYMEKLGTQEDEIEKLRGEIQTLEEQVAESQQSLTEFLGNLTLE